MPRLQGGPRQPGSRRRGRPPLPQAASSRRFRLKAGCASPACRRCRAARVSRDFRRKPDALRCPRAASSRRFRLRAVCEPGLPPVQGGPRQPGLPPQTAGLRCLRATSCRRFLPLRGGCASLACRRCRAPASAGAPAADGTASIALRQPVAPAVPAAGDRSKGRRARRSSHGSSPPQQQQQRGSSRPARNRSSRGSSRRARNRSSHGSAAACTAAAEVPAAACAAAAEVPAATCVQQQPGSSRRVCSSRGSSRRAFSSSRGSSNRECRRHAHPLHNSGVCPPGDAADGASSLRTRRFPSRSFS